MRIIGSSLEQTWIIYTQGCVVPLMVELVLVKKIFEVIYLCIFAISQLSPLGKGQGPSFEKTWIPFTQGCLCQVRLKLAQWFWRRSWKCEKFMTMTTENGQILIRTEENFERLHNFPNLIHTIHVPEG